MTTFPVPIWLNRLVSPWLLRRRQRLCRQRSDLTALAQLAPACLPRFVQESAVALQYLHLLGMLDWSCFPNRNDQRFAPDRPPLSYAALAAAYLVKLDQHLPYVANLRQYLVQHPALVWVLGFPLTLGACNPPLANQALQADLDVGLLLPCNVIIFEEGTGSAVSIIDPIVMLAAVASPELEPVASEARARLLRVIEIVTR